MSHKIAPVLDFSVDLSVTVPVRLGKAQACASAGHQGISVSMDIEQLI
jgi:hypothetical protein